MADRFVAYPEGFVFTLSAWAPNAHAGGIPFSHCHRDRMKPELPPDVIRLGVAFADGRATTNYNVCFHDPVPAEGPVLSLLDSDGYTPHWEAQHWVGPLPPAGAITLFVEWPAEGIVETAMELDADAIREAAARADVVWE